MLSWLPGRDPDTARAKAGERQLASEPPHRARLIASGSQLPTLHQAGAGERRSRPKPPHGTRFTASGSQLPT